MKKIPKIMAIYCIRNLNNGKLYVGSTKDLVQRWGLHHRQLRSGRHHSPHLQRSWDLYGESNFQFEILETVLDINNLVIREQFYFDLFKPWEPDKGYNCTPLAGSNQGRKLSPEACAKISARFKGKKKSAEHRAKIGAAHKGRKYDSATKERMRQAALKRTPVTGRPCSEETRKKISAALSGEKSPQYGKPLTEETRQKIGAKSKGRQTFIGRRHSEETKKKMSESRLKMLAERKNKDGPEN